MTRYSSESRKEHLPDQNRIREMEYFQSMYPQSMKMLQRYVSEECDRMDYKGSPMYDEYPDMLMIEQTCRNICSRIPDTVFSTGNEGNFDVFRKENGEVLEWELDKTERSEGMTEPVGPTEPAGPIETTESIVPAEPSMSAEPGMPGELWENMDVEHVEIYETRGRGGRPPQGPPPWGPPPGRPPQGPPPGRPPQGSPPWGPPPGRPPQGPPPWGPPNRPPQGPPPWGQPGRPPHRPPAHSNWMQDIIRVLLTNEMQNRRCRAGRC